MDLDGFLELSIALFEEDSWIKIFLTLYLQQLLNNNNDTGLFPVPCAVLYLLYPMLKLFDSAACTLCDMNKQYQ